MNYTRFKFSGGSRVILGSKDAKFGIGIGIRGLLECSRCEVQTDGYKMNEEFSVRK